MNLINDVWIPVRRKNGEKLKIAPWQITEGFGTDKEIVELVAVRPDFNGALIQFLIGLLQTTCAPKGNIDWREWFNNPPSADEFKSKFAPIAFAFNLDADGPRFMQDLTIEDETDRKNWVISKLLPGFPGIETIDDNTDFFIKGGTIKKMCLQCSAVAVFMAQIYARSGGAGWRQGLRGSNPATTIIKGNNLWETSWVNVVGSDQFLALGNIDKKDIADKFPWMSKTKTSENDEQVLLLDVHPAQIFWQMPWRIKLVVNKKQDCCDVCGINTDQGIVYNMLAKNYGVNYDGIWKHPLTPYSQKTDDPASVRPVNIGVGGIGYKHWMGMVFPRDNEQSALSIREFTNRQYGFRSKNIHLWVFGYDMKKDKARCWYEGVMPVIFIDNEKQWKHYNSEIAMLIRAAEMVSGYLSKAVVKALNAGVFNTVRQRFWQETESEFYRQIASLRVEVIQDKDGISVRQAWHNYLIKTAKDIFDDMSQAEMIEDVNAERVAKAYNELIRNLSGKKLKIDILGLPKEGGSHGD